MPQSFDTLRVGHLYEITNHGETVRFVLLEIHSISKYIVKDVTTLEKFNLFDLVKYGIGKDYDLFEIEEVKGESDQKK